MSKRMGFVTFRVSPKERRVFEILAAREDRTISELMREFFREGAERRGIQAVGLVDLHNEGRQDDK